MMKHPQANTHDLEVGNDRNKVIQLVQQRLKQDCPYAYQFRDVNCDFDEGVLTLRGRLRTFYMKQMLQTLLKDIDGVKRIDNRVGVVSSTGLSSVRDN